MGASVIRGHSSVTGGKDKTPPFLLDSAQDLSGSDDGAFPAAFYELKS